MLGIPVLAVEENIWREGQSFTIETKPYTSGVVEKGNCTMQTIAVFSSPDLSASRYACVMTNEKIAIARYVADFEERYAVKKSSDVMFHLLANISPRRYTLSMTPQTDYLLLKNSTYSSGVDEAEYELYRDPTIEFEYDALTGTYNLNKEKGHSLFSIQGAAVGETRFSRPAPMAVSNNGKFGFTYTASRLAVVVNLTTGEERVIDKIPRDSSVPDPYAPMAGTISNDGRYAFLTNSDRMYDTSEACGEPLSTILYTNNNPMNHPCPNTNLSALIREKIKYSYNAVLYSFNDDNTALSYITYYNTSPDGIKEEVIIKTEGFGVVKGPKYLALGDSYASGQGDLDAKGIGQYTLDTNQPTGCHISRRAYPYLLARDWGLSDTTMHSIACAGARREPDINSPAASYMGQNKQFSGYNQ
jgi:hypothetical protein